MSRLIDADELETDTEWSDYYDEFISYSSTQIENAPTVHAVPIEELQEIRQEIETAQTYKIASGSHDLYIDRDNALEIIDSHIEQYKEDAE